MDGMCTHTPLASHTHMYRKGKVRHVVLLVKLMKLHEVQCTLHLLFVFPSQSQTVQCLLCNQQTLLQSDT